MLREGRVKVNFDKQLQIRMCQYTTTTIFFSEAGYPVRLALYAFTEADHLPASVNRLKMTMKTRVKWNMLSVELNPPPP